MVTATEQRNLRVSQGILTVSLVSVTSGDIVVL